MLTSDRVASPHRGRVEVLDLLRLVAVLAVVVFHYAFRGAAADDFTTVSLPDLVGVTRYGYLGVNLFFVISGFVIAYSADGRTPTEFAIARLARIYPGFLVCMTLTFLVTMAIGAPRFETTITQWLANLVIASPALKQPFMDGAYWSIVYELTFYGWVFLLMCFSVFSRQNDRIVICWIFISMFNDLVLHSSILQRLFITDDSAFFCAGLVLYEFFRGRRDAIVMMLLALTSLTALRQAFVEADWLRDHYQLAFDNGVIAAICLGSIGAVALATRVRHVPLSPAIILAVGGLTYPLYLLHQHIGYMLLNCFADWAPPGILIAVVAFVMIIASLAIWRLIERPAQRALKPTLIAGADRLAALAAPLRLRVTTALRAVRAGSGARGPAQLRFGSNFGPYAQPLHRHVRRRRRFRLGGA
jgi:peptidoglycan/LPS O-acetylase OafA/YrhL